MADPREQDGLAQLTELITKPRRVTPSLTGGRRVAAPVVPSREPEPTPTPRRQSPRPRAGAAPPEPPPPAQPRKAARYVTAGLLTLRPEQQAWVRELRVAALRAGDDLALTDLVRVALDRLREAGATWPDLREAILVETRQRSRRQKST